MNRVIEKEKDETLLSKGIRFFLATNNENYVNQLSIWAADFLFFPKCWRYPIPIKYVTNKNGSL